ncbi:uncharacterized protein LOC107261157 [Ricinus communis]|uniref:uncharacterized protein LOC107261157 n=1 Tax=Ricinus communis TaxID=3988 RepID=UPI00201A5588|nr:uncharacterized protein LOC107261157 [Ricinus communis]
MYVIEYEMFKMKPNEFVIDMTNRLLTIINNMRNLGKYYELVDINNKILKSLPLDKYDARVASIEEVNDDLGKVPMDVLIGKLLTHEMSLMRDEVDRDCGKKKTLALKTSTRAQDAINIPSDDEEQREALNESDNMALVTKHFKRKLEAKRRRSNKPFISKKTFSKSRTSKDKKEEVTCYKCGKQEHIKPDCPKYLKRKKGDRKNKKSLEATWSDASSSSNIESEREDEVCLKSTGTNLWYVDSGCSKHMTSDSSLSVDVKDYLLKNS